MIRRILLIDDDGDDRDLFREALEKVSPATGYLSAADWEEALLVLRGAMPDIIFLDINMPFVNGWDCLRRLKSDLQLRHIPVALYTTSSTIRDRQAAEASGAQAFYTKPDSFQELKRLLQKVVFHLENGSILDLH